MTAPIRKSLDEIANGIFAYTQLPGSWGWSNAGLITDGGQSLLVDTLFDLKLTGEMLDAMRRTVPAARRIDTVVNTHGNGDHCYGNALVASSEIIGTRGCVEDLAESPPSQINLLLRAGRIVDSLGAGGRLIGKVLSRFGIHRVTFLSEAVDLALPAFEQFDFSGIEPVPPSRVFDGELELRVGDKEVRLFELGPAHTKGDAVVYVPGDKTLFTGDLLFKESHPLIWEGPVSNWIGALQRLLELDIDTVVPGHGPLSDKTGLREMLDYLETLSREARRRYDAGMSVDDAARDMSLDEFKGWLDPERVYVNTHTLYREFDGDPEPADILMLFAKMGRLKRDLAT